MSLISIHFLLFMQKYRNKVRAARLYYFSIGKQWRKKVNAEMGISRETKSLHRALHLLSYGWKINLNLKTISWFFTAKNEQRIIVIV